MPYFVDMKGRKWTLVLSVGLADRIKNAVGVDFLAKDISAAFKVMAEDPMKLVGVLWELVSADAERANIAPEAFGMALGGDAISDATEALMEAIVDFSRRSMRPAMKKALDAARQAEVLMGKRAEEAVGDPNLPKMLAEMLATSGAGSGKSPESST